MIKDIEDAIKLHLSQLGERLRLPSQNTITNPNEYDFLLRVSHTESQFETPKSLEGFGKQKGTIKFLISLEIKDYNTKEQAKEIYEEIQNLLMDFYPRVPGVIGSLFVQSITPEKNTSKGIYEYKISCSLPIVVIKQNITLGFFSKWHQM
jgi:hypothetical protein